MIPKRKTIDSIRGVRIRARTYADSHVAKSTPVRIVNDVSRPVMPITTNTMNKTVAQSIDRIAIESAKTIVRHRAVAPSVIGNSKAPNNVVRPMYEKSDRRLTSKPDSVEQNTKAESIHSLIGQIQEVENSKYDRLSNPANTHGITGIKGRLKLFKDSMFASSRSTAMTAMASLLLVGGTVALVSAFTTNSAVNSQVKALNDKIDQSVDESLGATDSSSMGMPSEDEIPGSVIDSYTTADDEPRYIHIPKIKNPKTRVLKMSVGKDNAVQTPRTTWDTGWYDGSSKPGDPVGSALIIGHVSGLTKGGVFYNLYRVTDGDEIIVEMGDGTKYTYTVVSKEEVPLDNINMNNYLVSKNIDKPGLTLMTCAGEYNPLTGTYDKRLAVFAVRAN